MHSLRILSQLRPMVSTLRCIQPIASSINYTITNGSHTQLTTPSDLHLNIVRHYAKGKDKKLEKGKGKQRYHSSFQLDDDQLNEIINISNYNEQLQKTLNQQQEDFIQNLSLRSTTGAIDSLKVPIDGKVHELQELAQISRKSGKTVIINMIGFPQMIPAVLKALSSSGMNLNPQQEGTTLYIPIPKVTKEHRENLSKNAKALYIKYREMIKKIQNDAIKKVKKNNELSEDVSHSVQGQLTSIADEYVAKSEKMMVTKQKELLGES